MRDHIDTGVELPDDPRFKKILNTPRRMLGWSFEPKMLPYREAIQRTFAEMMDKRPTQIIETAVKGMLPKTKLGREMGKKLKVYAGSEHPHAAQQPQPLPDHI